MKITARRVVAWMMAAAVTAGIAALSRIPYSPENPRNAVLRLSWRARGERVQECRPLTEEERRSLPQHMQQREVCEGMIAPYELTAALGNKVVIHDTIHGGGVREDRPLYVNREIYIEPGPHDLRVAFQRLGAQEGSTADPQAVPRELQLDTTFTAAPGEIQLVTYLPERRRLVMLGPRD